MVDAIAADKEELAQFAADVVTYGDELRGLIGKSAEDEETSARRRVGRDGRLLVISACAMSDLWSATQPVVTNC
jgi:hypothetical protein